MSEVQAVVFDLDGTLVDNLPYHLQAFVDIGKKLGVEVTAERFEREFSCRRNEEIFPALLGRKLSAEECTRLANEKEAHYRELYAPELRLLPGAAELFDALNQRRIPMAIASAAPALNRKFVIEGLGLAEHFRAVVGGEDVQRGKPAPDLFLEAAKRLGVVPSACIAFEDALMGVRAAVAAGMDVAAVTTTTKAHDLREAGATWTSRDFTELAADLRARLRLGE